MRKKKLEEKVAWADELADAVNCFRKEHDHPIRDSRMVKIHYDHMIKVLRIYQELDQNAS